MCQFVEYLSEKSNSGHQKHGLSQEGSDVDLGISSPKLSDKEDPQVIRVRYTSWKTSAFASTLADGWHYLRATGESIGDRKGEDSKEDLPKDDRLLVCEVCQKLAVC
jgi:hypothetical protein